MPSTRTASAVLAILSAAVLAAPAAGATPPPTPIASPATSEVVLAANGAWCWFADPRAIAYGRRAVFGWVAGDGSIMVGDDLGRQAVLDPHLEQDDHDDPAFYVRRDGRLMAFWSAHNGPAIRYRTAERGITSWGPVRDAPPNPPDPSRPPGGFTYPNPMRVGTTLYLFWSGADTTATYAASPDDGDTWTAAKPLFDPAGPRVRYAKYRRDGDEIHVAWTLGHPRERDSAVYHAVIRGDRVEHQDGRPIGRLGVPVDPTAGDVVHPQDAAGAWVHDLVVRDGRPTIAYATFPTNADHRYRWATWDGTRFADEELTAAGGSFEGSGNEPNYSGGVTLDPADPDVAYVSRVVGAHHELDRATRTPDGWTFDPITRGSGTDNVRPYPVAGGLAWMRGSYPAYTAFRTALVWRPRGAVVPAAGPRLRIDVAGVRRGGPLRVRTGLRRGRLELRLARAPDGVALRPGPRRAFRIVGGRATVTVPRVTPGRWRASVWQGDRRLAVRTMTVARRRG
ncbi:BNR-4 repeat-containing protein [Patulibacter sp. NPDC049589]|uniref:BNR-4 repeat-containing protein n=1 Tax=Patulibacter sp. NPDC049589 TaxID=3154731 RepID=UPI00343CBD23